MKARLSLALFLASLVSACGGASTPSSAEETLAAPTLDPRPPLVELVGPEADFLAWLHMEPLRASPRYGIVLSLFDRSLPADYAGRDFAHDFADRTETVLLALVDGGARRDDFLYLLRGRYAPGDLDGLMAGLDPEVPFVEETHAGVLVRRRGAIGAALVADHTWLFGAVVRIQDALDRYEGSRPRGQAHPELLTMAGRLGTGGATLGLVARNTPSVVSTLLAEVPDRAGLLSHLTVGGVVLDLGGGVDARGLLVAESAEVAQALAAQLTDDLVRYRRHPAIFALGLASAAGAAQATAAGTDVSLRAGIDAEQLDVVLRRLRLMGVVD